MSQLITPKAASRIPALDGLRGLAVLLILVHHAIELSPLLVGPPGAARSYLKAALGLSPSGVDLFFVLSGFLIGGILIDHRDSPRLLKGFYARRFFRTVPLAWVNVLAGLLLWRASAAPSAALSAPDIPWICGFTFTVNFYLAAFPSWLLTPITQHWSLGIEEQFYLLFPWLVKACPPRKMLQLSLGLILTSLLSRALILTFAPQFSFACFMLPFCRADSLGAGFCAAVLVRRADWASLQPKRSTLWLSMAALGAALALLLRNQNRAPVEMLSWGFTVIAIFYAILLVLALDPQEPWLRFILNSGFLRIYGRYSFFIYLFQGLLAQPLTTLLFHHRWGFPTSAGWIETIASIFVILIPAALSWHLFEAPLLRWGRKWRYE